MSPELLQFGHVPVGGPWKDLTFQVKNTGTTLLMGEMSIADVAGRTSPFTIIGNPQYLVCAEMNVREIHRNSMMMLSRSK